jgi:hypothetical protein
MRIEAPPIDTDEDLDDGRVGSTGRTMDAWAALRPRGKCHRLGGDERSAVLKIINANKIEREPYQRFVREINFLRELRGAG